MPLKKFPNLTDLSHELLCHILQYLPLKEVLSISMLCKKLLSAVAMHLRLIRCIDFCEGKIYGYMPASLTDDHMHALLKKCPNLEIVYGLHPLKVERRRLRKRSALTVPGIIEALSLCCNLKSIETSDLRLLEAIMQHLPQLEIIGHFINRGGAFPPHASQRLKLQPYPRISSLHLIGVEVPELTAMPHLTHLHLHCVRFTKLQPFRAFLAQNLKTFVMKHCMGPSLSLRYLSLIIALSSSPSLSRLELVRVPLPGGLFQRAVEDSYRHNGFVNLKTLVISGCKGVLEADIGHLMIVASKNLETIYIQPSLTRDSLFVSLSFAQCEFPKLKNLHLGFVDKLSSVGGEWSNDTLLSLGLAEVPDTPSSLTDSGMKVISQLFPYIKSMSVSNCPHLMSMDQWSPIEGEQQAWKELTDLTLQRCHCLQLPSFALFLAFLPKIEVVILNDMFREPPKGCSHVGLSAGTGLGMSSAVVSNQDEHIAVQGHQQDFELQPDDHMENDEIDRDFIDVENDENPDQHIMVLQQEFFDDENPVVPPPMQRDDVIPEHRIENDEPAIPENPFLHEPLGADYNEFSDDEEDRKSYTSTLSEQSASEAEHASASCQYKMSDSNVKSAMAYLDTLKRVPKSKRVTKSPNVPKSCTSSTSSNENSEGLSKNDASKLVDHPQSDLEPRRKKNLSSGKSCNASKECKNKYWDSFDPNQPSTSKGGNCLNCPAFSEDCKHSKECKNKCSKDFDPNQPSTSKGGNCLNCTCVDCDTESKESKPSVGNKRKTSVNDAVVSKKRKSVKASAVQPAEYNDFDNAAMVIKSNVAYSRKETFKGPLTRHRKRVLNAEIETESLGSKSHSRNDKQTSTDKKEYSSIACNTSESTGKSETNCQNLGLVQCEKMLPTSLATGSMDEDSEPNLEVKPKIEESDVSSIHVADVFENQEAEPTTKNQLAEPEVRAKKHRKHKHKRCRKAKRYENSCHTGPLTRSQKRKKYAHNDYNMVSQGTQATSADIRRSLRKQRSSSSHCRKRTGRRCRSHRSHSVSARHQFKAPVQSKSYKNLQNKSTSTSDPLMEDDAVQTLRLVSETLISLTIISCGISDVVIDHCHCMTHVEVQACRILKMFQLHYCPSLKRLSVSQCPKLSLNSIIPEVINLVATRKLLISYEPCMQVYTPADGEKAVFSRAPFDQGIILFHDCSANESIQAAVKERLLRWMEVLQKIYFTPTFWVTKLRKRNKKIKERSRFPYGHALRRIHGVFTLPESIDPTGTKFRYQVLTNDHVFASALENIPFGEGFPAPDKSENYTEDDALVQMFEYELREKRLKAAKKFLTFYIPVIENNSITTN